MALAEVSVIPIGTPFIRQFIPMTSNLKQFWSIKR